ncbi:MAG: dihydrolipoyllysine-residue acetyltransferase [Gammaproteobacteria bacterium]
MSDTRQVRVPDIGDFTDVEVIEVHVSEGDTVAEEDPLIKVSKGDKVSEGDVIVEVETDSGGAGESATPDSDGDEGASGSGSAVASAGKDDAGGASNGNEGATGGGRREVHVPDIGDFDAVEIIEIHVSEGDTVEREDPLITLESDKAAMDVPSPEAGRVASLAVGQGDKVSEGDLILVLEGGGAAAAGGTTDQADATGKKAGEKGTPARDTARPAGSAGQEADASQGGAEAQDKADTAVPGVGESGFSKAHAGPSVRKLARELGVDLEQVEGSGRKGRITHEDVKAWVKKAITRGESGRPQEAGTGLPAVPEVDFTKFGETELRPLSRVQKIAGPRLHASWVNLPHVTQFDEADITEMERARKDLKADAEKEGARLTPLPFVMRACVKALQAFPEFNASLHPDGERLVVKKYYNLGFAVDTPGGLVVPVIRDVEGKTLFRVARELGDLSEKGRAGKLSAAELQGGCFTVSSLGSIGGTAFTPIINAPEVAILGVSRARMQPVWNGEDFEPRLMLPLSLSYDHRVIDGAAAVRFTRFLAEILADVDRLLA